MCSACHQAHHDGRLTISGTADRIEVRRPGAHVGATDAATPAGRPGARVNATEVATPASHPGARVGAVPAARPGARVGAVPASRPGAHVSATEAAMSIGTGARVGAASKLDGAVVRTQAKTALIGLGWKPAIAHAAVAAAVAEGTEMTLERLIVEALRRCPVPRA